jgi:endonuclease/exonuclease/phosphatase family metal-dependent hydrolase
LGGEFEVHFVNTHLDAGRAAADRAARRAQLAELRVHLEREAAGAALVVAGDLNLRAADPLDVALRDEFAHALGLVDTGAAAPSESAWERLDYVYRRDGSAVLLEVLEAGEAREFVDEAARPLSDHPALFVRLRARPVF